MSGGGKRTLGRGRRCLAKERGCLSKEVTTPLREGMSPWERGQSTRKVDAPPGKSHSSGEEHVSLGERPVNKESACPVHGGATPVGKSMSPWEGGLSMKKVGAPTRNDCTEEQVRRLP